MKNRFLKRIKPSPILFLFFIFIVENVYSVILPIKDLVKISSFRENQISGYGIVVGLSQTGDNRSVLAKDSLKKILSFHNISLSDKRIRSKNIAAVYVTAKIPPVSKKGDSVDIWVSSIGDAKSIKGGVLLQTPLKAGNGRIYAVAQGVVSYVSSTKGLQKKINSIYIPKSAVLERDLVQKIYSIVKVEEKIKEKVNGKFIEKIKKYKQKHINLNLNNFNISTVQNILVGINKKYKKMASFSNSGQIVLVMKEKDNHIQILSEIYKIKVDSVIKTKVVLDPNSGTIVMGGEIGISSIGITKNGIKINIKNQNDNLGYYNKHNKNERSNAYVNETTTVQSLVDALNLLGLTAKDIIDIIKAIHAAGALHAELVII